MNQRLADLVKKSFSKFKPNLAGKKVLTEAASGNYVVTSILSAMAGAEVWAIAKDSHYASVEEIKTQTAELAEVLEVEDKISIITSLEECPLAKLDVVTNTGFVRPIDATLIKNLKSQCVVPLMWEAWEFRAEDLDIKACDAKGIEVRATNESDLRLRTLEYIGFQVLKLLLNQSLSPFSTKVLLIGCEQFVKPVYKVLKQNQYTVESCQYDVPKDLDQFDCLVILEHELSHTILGFGSLALIQWGRILHKNVIHIAGNVDMKTKPEEVKIIPQKPKKFGYMSFTADTVDPQAVIDLHCAGLKVSEEMLNKKYTDLSYPLIYNQENDEA